MKRLVLLAVLLVVGQVQAEAVWKNLTPDNYLSGPQIAPTNLLGKVVLVEWWGINCPVCKTFLPHMEKLWQTYKEKPFVLIGSHRQGKEIQAIQNLAEQYNLTYPIYQGAGLQGEPGSYGIPFLYIVNHRGRVLYKGFEQQAVINTIERAIKDAQGDYDLTGGVTLKHCKEIAAPLTFGKPIRSVVQKLKREVARGQGRFADEAAKAKGQEAESILAALKAARVDIANDIKALKKRDAAAAAKLKKKYDKTFS